MEPCTLHNLNDARTVQYGRRVRDGGGRGGVVMLWCICEASAQATYDSLISGVMGYAFETHRLDVEYLHLSVFPSIPTSVFTACDLFFSRHGRL
jgi:hypothetical protein